MKRSSRPAGNIASAVLSAVDLMPTCHWWSLTPWNVPIKYQLERGFKHQTMLKPRFPGKFWGKLQVYWSIIKTPLRPDVGRLQLPQEAPDLCQKWHCGSQLKELDGTGTLCSEFWRKKTGSGWWIYRYGDTKGGDPASWQGEGTGQHSLKICAQLLRHCD